MSRGRVDSAQVETTLLALKIAFLVLLYLFIWRIVRSAARDLRLPQESMILSPQQAVAAAGRSRVARELGRLVVVTSPALEQGDACSDRLVAADDRPRRRATTSRSTATSTRRRVTRASSRAATASTSRTSARRTARSSTASGSTASAASRRGDVVRVGETDLRFEQ